VELNQESAAKREAWRRRVLALAAVVAVAFVGLLGQLWYLQVLEGGKLQELSDRNRIRIRPVAAPRGILFDRNGLALVDNRPAFTLSLIPREMEDRGTVLARLSVLLKIPLQELEEGLERVPPASTRPFGTRRGPPPGGGPPPRGLTPDRRAWATGSGPRPASPRRPST